MNFKLINPEPKTYAVIFDSGDRVMPALERFAREQGLTASSFTAIGAFSQATLGFFDMETKDYRRIEITEQTEVLSFLGDIAMQGSDPKIHAHVVLGKIDGTAHGGHLIDATVRPTLEVVLTELPGHLRRKHDPETGLALIHVAHP
jgi:uncharacterized protein